MGALLLCNRPIAAMPYYIEALSLNIYSLEELCYVIEHHPFLLDEGFFDDDMICWIEREAGEEKLAEQLRHARRKELGITKLVELILNATGYLSYEAGMNILGQIREMQHKTVFERRKMRADRYVENKKYINALLEYRRILQMEEECKKNPVMCGNIWHNQGTVYARLFLFREARECFEKAYRYHMNLESIYEAMAACRYLGEDEALMELARKYGIDEREVADLSERWTHISRSETIARVEEEIDAIFARESDFWQEVPLEENAALMQMLHAWKVEYQKNCR